MTRTITKDKEVSGTKPEETQTNDSSVPIWKEQHGRVQGAMWKHPQEDGKVRYTISVSRSYKDDKTKKWVSVHYFDQRDLKDVRSICDQADAEILNIEGMTTESQED